MSDMDGSATRSWWRRPKLIVPLSVLLVVALALAGTLAFVSRGSDGPNAYQRLYHQTWQQVNDRFYDPDQLLDWENLEHAYDDEIDSRDDALRYANQMLNLSGDRFADLFDTSNGGGLFNSLNHDGHEHPGDQPAADGSDEGRPKAVTVVRSTEGIDYIWLRSFLAKDVSKMMTEALEATADGKALIVDLRFNGGGYTDEAVKIAQLFMDEGVIVKFRERIPATETYQDVTVRLTATEVITETTDPQGKVTTKSEPRLKNLVGDKPVVVLINGASASAAELLSGALKDNDRALLLGTRTFGKGVGQSVIKLAENTELHVTTMRVYTPSGHWVGDGDQERYGLEPHQEVRPQSGATLGGADDNQLHAAVEILRERLAA
jgi:hypothetical protein